MLCLFKPVVEDTENHCFPC